MVEVLSWGGGAHPDDIACRCYCVCICDCWCSCSGQVDPAQYGDVAYLSSSHCETSTTTSNVNGTHTCTVNSPL
ncbi:MAG: hypothetical protein ACUVTF_08290 [bacterium]